MVPIKFQSITNSGLSGDGLKTAKLYGGKVMQEIPNATNIEKDTGVEIPRGFFYSPEFLDQSQHRGRMAALAKMEKGKEYLARACLLAGTQHPGDLGMGTAIDMLPTVSVRCERDLIQYFEDLASIAQEGQITLGENCQWRQAASYKGVKDYYRYEGGDPNALINKIGVLVVPMQNGYSGSMIEHPGANGVYIVELDKGTVSGVKRTLIKESDQGVTIISGSYISDKNAQKLINSYKEVKSSTGLPPSSSMHMEFTSPDLAVDESPIYIHQRKMFLHKYTNDEWQLDPIQAVSCSGRGTNSNNAATTEDYSSFGITKKEGIELDLFMIEGEGDEHPKNKISGDFAMAYSDSGIIGNTHGRPALTFQPEGNMKAGLFYGTSSGCIEHGGHWVLANAEGVSLWQHRLGVMNPHRPGGVQEIKVRIISDGTKARVTRVSE
jgi:hypothetical protein